MAWKKIEEFTVEDMQKGKNCLFYNKEWIDEEFCQDGIHEGYATVGDTDQEIEYAIATIDGEGEWNHTYDTPTHWMWHPDPPED